MCNALCYPLFKINRKLFISQKTGTGLRCGIGNLEREEPQELVELSERHASLPLGQCGVLPPTDTKGWPKEGMWVDPPFCPRWGPPFLTLVRNLRVITA